MEHMIAFRFSGWYLQAIEKVSKKKLHRMQGFPIEGHIVLLNVMCMFYLAYWGGACVDNAEFFGGYCVKLEASV